MALSRFHLAVALLFTVLASASASNVATQPGPLTKGDDQVLKVTTTASLALAATAATGLMNRAGVPNAFAMLRGDSDAFWLDYAVNSTASLKARGVRVVNSEELFAIAVKKGVIKGVLMYDPAEAFALPTVVTLASVHEALPVPTSHADLINSIPGLKALPKIGDTTGMWKSAMEATQYAYDKLMKSTSTMTFVFQDPALVAKGFLVDFCFGKNIMMIHMPDICIPLTGDFTLFRSLVSSSHFKTHPLFIMGYHPGVFESYNTCTPTKSEMTLASDMCSGLSFLSLLPRMKTPVLNPPAQTGLKYDPTKKYVSLVMSDGDNLQILGDSLLKRLRERMEVCDTKHRTGICPPMSWTVGPRALDFAPSYIQYYNEAMKSTGRDAALLPPSGYGYLYPALIEHPDDAAAFRKLTIDIATDLDTTAYVHWDWALTWNYSKEFIKQYSNSQIKGVFLGQVPWVLPEVTYDSDQLVDGIAIFKETVRWSSETNHVDGEPWSPEKVAAHYENNPPGSLSFTYLIFDLPYSSVEQMVKVVDKNVVFVGYRELIDLANQKYKKGMYAEEGSGGGAAVE